MYCVVIVFAIIVIVVGGRFVARVSLSMNLRLCVRLTGCLLTETAVFIVLGIVNCLVAERLFCASAGDVTDWVSLEIERRDQGDGNAMTNRVVVCTDIIQCVKLSRLVFSAADNFSHRRFGGNCDICQPWHHKT